MTDPLYKVKFVQQDAVVELVAKYISEESLMGFIEIEDIVFSGSGEAHCTDDKYRHEFAGLNRCYLPLHTLLRIDELSSSTDVLIGEVEAKKDNVRRFPGKQSASSKDDKGKDS